MTTTEITPKETTSCSTNGTCETRTLRPRFRTETADDGYTLLAEMPGVPKSNVKIELKDDLLTITGEKALPVAEDWKPMRREIFDGTYELKVRLTVPINADGITANSENGILHVKLPLAEHAQPRTIEVK